MHRLVLIFFSISIGGCRTCSYIISYIVLGFMRGIFFSFHRLLKICFFLFFQVSAFGFEVCIPPGFCGFVWVFVCFFILPFPFELVLPRIVSSKSVHISTAVVFPYASFPVVLVQGVCVGSPCSKIK